MARSSVPAMRLEIDASEATLPTSIRGPALIVFASLIVMLSGSFVWSTTASIASGAVARGRVTVDTGRKTISVLDGGIVKEIPVRDGDFVKAGQTLLQLDPSQLQLTRNLYRNHWDQDRALIARLETERDGENVVTFPSDLVEQATGEPVIDALLRAQRHQFDARRETAQGRANILRQKADELRAQIGGIEAQNAARERERYIIEDELGDMSRLLAKGLVPKPRVLELRRTMEQINSAVAAAESQIAAYHISIGEAEMQILNDRKALEQEVVEQLRLATTESRDAQDRIAAIDDQLRHLTVASPIDGQVIGLTLHTIGGVVASKERLMYVVPHGEQLVIETQISPGDIDHVQVGQRAVVRLPALRARTTPTVNGSVLTVSSDVTDDADQHQQYYSARITIPPDEIEKLGEQKLVAGMPAEVLIETGKRTVMDYALGPIKDAIFRSFREN